MVRKGDLQAVILLYTTITLNAIPQSPPTAKALVGIKVKCIAFRTTKIYCGAQDRE